MSKKPILKATVKSSTKTKPVAKAKIRLVTKSDLNKIVVQSAKAATIKTQFKKKKLAEVTPEHETYFVYLRQPLEYRRHLLESSRKILFCLRSHHKVVLIRQKKLEEMNKLKTCVRELLYLNKKFNEKLPKYNMHFLSNVPSTDKVKPINIKTAALRKPAEIRPDRTELERLEESLANIEKKLKTLQ